MFHITPKTISPFIALHVIAKDPIQHRQNIIRCTPGPMYRPQFLKPIAEKDFQFVCGDNTVGPIGFRLRSRSPRTTPTGRPMYLARFDLKSEPFGATPCERLGHRGFL